MYYPPQKSLNHIFIDKQTQLNKFTHKYGKLFMDEIKKVKLYDYSQIDSLQSHHRHVINVFYQEI